MSYKQSLAAVAAVVALLIACQRPSSTGTTATPVAGRGASTNPSVPSPGAARVRVRLSPDSLSKLRAITVSQVLASIAGRENEPAGTVFKNVQVSKDIPAGAFVRMMDTTYGRALSWNCTNCHVTTDFSSDSRHDKLLARTMQQMTNTINSEYMPKIDPKDPPRATCMNCHRGVNIPSDSADYRVVPPTAASRPPAVTGTKPPAR